MSHPEFPVVVLKPRKALPFFSQHPWLYAGTIGSVSGSIDVGTQVLVKSHEGAFVGYGLYNPASKIRVRLYSWDEAQPLDAGLVQSRIQQALDLRKQLFAETPAWKACRLIFSEADGLSGLTVDRADEWLVLQWTSAALMPWRDEIIETLQSLLNPRGMWLRTEKGIGELEGLDLMDGLLAGEAPPRPLLISENGLQFEVDLVEGQKTGYYFDQRENRQRVQQFARGRVLDVCCYSGSFAIHAASQTACDEVVGVDSSAAALDLAKRNADLNGVGDKISFVDSDAVKYMEQAVQRGEHFDTVILDPPKMARTRGGLGRAIKGYIRMNQLAMKLVAPQGTLVTCSCSGLVSREDFEQILLKSSLEAGRTVQILEERGQAVDHPTAVSCLESSYLKCIICRVI